MGHIISAELFKCTCYARNNVGQLYFILRNSRGSPKVWGLPGCRPLSKSKFKNHRFCTHYDLKLLRSTKVSHWNML